MQRRLIIMRHAKSDWDADAQGDHDRPLSERGKREAPRVGKELARRGWVPERVLSSDARRARQTWKRVRKSFGDRVEATLVPSLYLGGVDELRQALGALPDAVGTAMAIGHNPGWEQALLRLTGEPVRMTTANAALLVADADTWAEAAARDGGWKLEAVLRPKEI
ncbi:MAG: histidine phosphatase family protein [Deltaproteobacteria bacterium]|nr:histidine phosphatase family protein [Deltaproteobacteria bacterium]